jgi:uncharacterized membrane protein YgdD (TMEM256/DUF423 family)
MVLMFKIFLLLGGLNAFIAVMLGAFGAHGLKNKLTPEMLAIYQTGVQYHMIHALGLILISILSERLNESVLVSWSGWLLFGGIIFFSGSLYALSLSGITKFGTVAPIGGTAFLAGWIILVWAAYKL